MFKRKGGSSAARAARAKKGHRRRVSRSIMGGSRHYKGGRQSRTKGAWLF